MATYNYSSGSVPVPAGPNITGIGSGTYGGSVAPGVLGSFNPGTSSLLAALLNQMQSVSQAGLALAGSGCYGIISGLGLSSPSGLQILVAAGVAAIDAPLELVASSPQAPYQATLPAAYVLPASSTSFVWLTAAGAITSTTSLIPPALGKVFLGTVVTSASAVTSIDSSGIVFIENGVATRQLADYWAPSDSPTTSGPVVTKTQGGLFIWINGAWWFLSSLSQQVPTSSRTKTISANLTLVASDANIQVITASASGLIVTLPAVAGINIGSGFTFYNPGATNSFAVKTAGGTTICTVGTGQYVVIPATLVAGAPEWVASATPISIPTGTT